MRRKNPILASMDNAYCGVSGKKATFAGIGSKLLLCTLMTVLGVSLAYIFPSFVINGQLFFVLGLVVVNVLMIGAISKNPAKAKAYALIYSLTLGLAYGGIIYLFSKLYAGVVEAALITTLCVLMSISLCYFTGLIRNGSLIRKVTFTLSFGFLIFMGINMLLGLFGTGLMYSTNPSVYLLVSLVSAALSVLYLVGSIDSCNRLVISGGPKEYEWTVSVGLLCNLVWLFVDLLQIFALFSDQDN